MDFGSNCVIQYIVYMLYFVDRLTHCVSSIDENVYKTNLAWQRNLWKMEHVQNVCESLNVQLNSLPPLNDLDHILVDHNHQLLYCYVPKVACTNWKRLFMIMSNRWNSTNIMTIPGYVAHASGSVTRLSELSEEEAIRCLRDYTRFIVVRHPFERLLSAYRNKLEGKHPSAQYFQSRVGRYIIKHYRANASSDSLKYGHDVTFYEFAQYLLVEGKDKRVHNEHWRPISKLCHPCSISYNVIGTYENLVEDSDLVLSLVNAANLSFPNTKTANTAHRIYDYFRQLSLETTKELYRFYELDFKLFGYDLVNILGYDVG